MIVLLGPQRRPSLARLVEQMGLEGPFATITAGWEEHEVDDAELDAHLRGHSHNLRLWHRMQEIFAAEPEFARSHQRARDDLLELQDLYRLALGHARAAIDELTERTTGSKSLREAATRDALEIMRSLDAQHMTRVQAVHARFYEENAPHELGVVQHHRGEVAALLANAGGVVITGGHVVQLIDALHLLNVTPSGLDRLPIIAWSAGAMALSHKVVLYDDGAVRGPRVAEVFDQGIGVLPEMIVLPNAKKRLATHDRLRMSRLARRFRPTPCVPLDPGTQIVIRDGVLPPDTTVLGPEGAPVPLGGDHGEVGDQPSA